MATKISDYIQAIGLSSANPNTQRRGTRKLSNRDNLYGEKRIDWTGLSMDRVVPLSLPCLPVDMTLGADPISHRVTETFVRVRTSSAPEKR